jgi:hypothetical protein
MSLDSRIRFAIQDLIDSYDRVWKHEIIRSRKDALNKPKKESKVDKKDG